MRISHIALVGFVCAASVAFADGPADRVPTNPRAVSSTNAPPSTPLPVDALLTTTRIFGVTHSNDGRKLAYTSSASGRLNLWIMNVDGTGAQQLITNNDRQVGAHFTHDNDAIIYSQDSGGNEYYDIYVVAVTGGEPRNLTNTADVSESVDEFSPDGKLLAIGVKPKAAPATNLAVMQWPGGAIRQLTHEADPKASWSENAWSPDGRFLYATRSIGIDDSDIFRIDVATGASERLLKHTGKQVISISDVSRDGHTLLVTSNANGGYENVALLDLATKKLTWLTHTQWSAGGVAFTPDGGTVVVGLERRWPHLNTVHQSENDGAVRTWCAAGIEHSRGLAHALPAGWLDAAVARGLKPSRRVVPPGAGRLPHPDHTQCKRKPAAHRAPQIATGNLPQLRRNDDLGVRLGSLQPEARRQGAAVVMPHGGPTGQVIDAFNGRAELLASRGFVVIAPNVRGSTGYGMDFQNANIKDLGGADLKDEIAGVDFLKATGFIDPKRVGIWGGSYGGYMTLMAIGKTPDVWSAAVDEYGILNWMSMLEHEDPRLQEYEKTLLGDPVKDLAVYEASSPLKYIRNETAPLLVLQGENDIRVPREEAEQAVSHLEGGGPHGGCSLLSRGGTRLREARTSARRAHSRRRVAAAILTGCTLEARSGAG